MHQHQVTIENEKKTLIVILVTLVAMGAEIAYGYFTHSMALLADGYHMGTHVLALGLTFIAYILIRSFSNSPLFPNGPHKIGTLAAYTSSLFLGLTGFLIIIEALERFFNPMQILFDEAILVAFIGLMVNVVCILIMGHQHSHSHNEKCSHQDKDDYNFKAAYYHILADALTSILAIAALLIGKYFNIIYLDSLIGILGGILIIRWAFGLLKHTSRELVDMK